MQVKKQTFIISFAMSEKYFDISLDLGNLLPLLTFTIFPRCALFIWDGFGYSVQRECHYQNLYFLFDTCIQRFRGLSFYSTCHQLLHLKRVQYFEIDVSEKNCNIVSMFLPITYKKGRRRVSILFFTTLHVLQIFPNHR